MSRKADHAAGRHHAAAEPDEVVGVGGVQESLHQPPGDAGIATGNEQVAESDLTCRAAEFPRNRRPLSNQSLYAGSTDEWLIRTVLVERVTTQNLTVVDVLPEKGLILIKGNVAGHNNAMVLVRPAIKSAMRKAHGKAS